MPNVLPDCVDNIRFIEYRRMMLGEFKRFTAQFPVVNKPLDFVLFGMIKYTDTPGRALPLLVLGDTQESPWQDYYETIGSQRPACDYAKGKSYLRWEGSRATLVLDVEHGKIRSKYAELLNRSLLRHLHVSLDITGDNEGADELPPEDIDLGPIPVVISPAERKRLEEEAKKTSKIREQAQTLNGYWETFRQYYQRLQNQIIPKIQNNKPTSRADVAQTRLLAEALDNFLELYPKVARTLREAFAEIQAQLLDKRPDLLRIARIVLAKKRCLAEEAANAFYQKEFQRDASEEEVEKMHEAIKKAFDYREVDEQDLDERADHIRAVILTAKERGPKFTPQDTDVVYDYITAA